MTKNRQEAQPLSPADEELFYTAAERFFGNRETFRELLNSWFKGYDFIGLLESRGVRDFSVRRNSDTHGIELYNEAASLTITFGLDPERDIDYALPLRAMYRDAAFLARQCEENQALYEEAQRLNPEEDLEQFEKDHPLTPAFSANLFFGEWDGPYYLHDICSSWMPGARDYDAHLVVVDSRFEDNHPNVLPFLSPRMGLFLRLASACKDQARFDAICRDNPDIASTLPTAGAVLLGFLAEREDLKAIGKELLNDPEDESVNLHAQPAQDPY